MIRKNAIVCKLIREKRTGKTIFHQCMDHLQPEIETCPYCRCRGKCRIHTYYNRSLIEFIDGRIVKSSLCVCQVICTWCQSTHAILPDPIIPYCRHSLFFILRVLAEHAMHLQSVERICEAFSISEKTFYRWLKLFQEHRSEWQGLLRFMETDLKAAILELVRKDPYSVFAASFFRLTGFSLLQSHKNPSHLPRKPQAGENGFP